MKNTWVFGMGLFLFSTLALAHPGHDMVNAYAGFVHPLTGWDHLLVMLAVGFWAGQIGGKARWQLPLTFMLVMVVGALSGLSGITLPGLETGIAASVLAIGLLIALHVPLVRVLQIWIVALFACLHGMAHGAELAEHNGYAVMFGILAATALLHASGLLLASRQLHLAQYVHRALGGMIALAGTYMLLA